MFFMQIHVFFQSENYLYIVIATATQQGLLPTILAMTKVMMLPYLDNTIITGIIDSNKSIQ